MKKNHKLNQTETSSYFWFCAAILVVLLVSIMARDITRPFYGLHSWGEAHLPWFARAHLNYGLRYTKGLNTWAVGNPPTENPRHYLDHPKLRPLLNTAFMAFFGVNEWSRRLVLILVDIFVLLLFLKIFKELTDDKITLLSGLLLVLFPLTGYFGLGSWPVLFAFLAFYAYLSAVGELKTVKKPANWNMWLLAAALFLSIQCSWTGFFFAMGIGFHYVARCVFRKIYPEPKMLAILIIAPFASMALTFLIMAAGYGWDFSKIYELYKWRSAKGEMAQFQWGAWLARFWELARDNFTLPVLITLIGYLTLGQLYVFMHTQPQQPGQRRLLQFPHLSLFLMPPVFQVLILRGALWKHQIWERPFGPFIAVGAALGIMVIYDLLKRLNKKLALAASVALMSVVLVSAVKGTNYYYSIRWQHPQKIEMLKWLNEHIPPDKDLLSFEPFRIEQHKSKGAHYRPEIAWYLDRDIETARTLSEIQQKAATGKYPYYLVPYVEQLSPLIAQLNKNYQMVKYVQAHPGKRTEDGKFYQAGMNAYMIFKLTADKGETD